MTGKYNGYTYSLKVRINGREYMPLEPGFYDENNNLVVSWEDSGIDVSIYYTNDNFKTLTTSGYSVMNMYPDAVKVVMPNTIVEIGSYAFKDCTSLKNIELPDNVIYIDGNAFEGCTSLTSIKIPDSVTSILGSVFEGCTSLTSIKIPDSVTYIGNFTFKDCQNLTSISIPSNITTIGYYAFDGCTNLESAKFYNTTGWYKCTATGEKIQALPSSDLSDPVAAVNHLKDIYTKKRFNE